MRFAPTLVRPPLPSPQWTKNLRHKDPASNHAAGAGPRIGVAVADPYLEYLVSDVAPEADIVVLDADVDADSCDLPVIVVDMDDPRAAAWIADPDVSVIAVVGAGAAQQLHAVPDAQGLVFRPFDRLDLAHTLRKVSGLGTKRLPYSPASPSMLRAIGVVRLAAIAIAAALEAASNASGPWRALLLTVLVAYMGLRLLADTRALRVFVAVDAAATCLALAVAGGLLGSYSILAAVVVFEAGLLLSQRHAMTIGVAITLSSVTGLIGTASDEGLIWGIAMLLWVPIAGVTGIAAARLWRISNHPEAVTMHAAHTLLSSLDQVIHALPEELDANVAMTRLLEEVTACLQARAVAVIGDQAGLLHVCMETGSSLEQGQIIEQADGTIRRLAKNRAQAVGRDHLPASLTKNLPDGADLGLARMAVDGLPIAYVLVVAHLNAADLRDLDRMTAETTIEVQSAHMIDRLRRVTLQEERRRVGEELHDSVAQVMTAMRLELSMLGRGITVGTETASEAATRLSHVFDEAGSRLRGLISELTPHHAGGDLRAATQHFIDDIQALGIAAIQLRYRASHELPSPLAVKFFDALREAVSLAIQRRGTRTIEVTVTIDETMVVCAVTDDGGMDLRDRERAMLERFEQSGLATELSRSDSGRCIEFGMVLQEAGVIGAYQ